MRIAGLVLVALAAVLPVADAATATLGDSPAIIELRASRWLFAVLVLIIIAATVVEPRPRYRDLARGSVFGVGLVMLLTPVVLIAALESLTAVLSPDMLPPVIQDLPPRGEPQLGVWLLIAGASLVMLSATDAAAPALARGRALGRGLLARKPESIAVLLGTVGIVLFVLGRYELWMSIDSNVADWNVVAQSAPVIGLSTLVVLGVCTGCVVAVAMRPSAPLGVATVTIGWMATLVPAAMLVVGRVTPSLTAPGWLRSRLADWSARGTELASGVPRSVPVTVPELPRTLEVDLVVERGTTMLFTAGLLMGLSGLFVLRASCRPGGR